MNAEQKARLKQVGKDAFIREEMTRLGYWPPSPEVAAASAEAEARLKVFYEELAALRTELDAVEKEIAESGDVPKLLADIRRKRIERVRAERAVKKEERAKARDEKRAADREWRAKTLPHLGRGVSEGLNFDGGNEDKLLSRKLPVLHSASDLAQAIGITEKEIAWLAYQRRAAGQDHYFRFTLPKKKGGLRVISSPKKRLRIAQAWILHNVLEPLPVHEAAVAFRPGMSVADNAARHSGRPVLVKVDLKDFFPSIGLRRVKRFFEHLGYNEGISTLLALLCTETPRVCVVLDGVKKFVALGERSVPQGACTSPALTNLLCRGLDARLSGAATSMGFAYTRYADDLVFSHEKPDAPVGMLLSLARSIVGAIGLTVNEEKTRVLRPQHRQVVTGVVVNASTSGGAEGPRISRDDLRRLRAICHQCDRDGFDTVSARLGKDARSYASGYLAFVRMVHPEQAARLTARHPWLA